MGGGAQLDPLGYFVIYIDAAAREIVADHYGNLINDQGLACDPRTGEVIPCDASYTPPPPTRFRRAPSPPLPGRHHTSSPKPLCNALAAPTKRRRQRRRRQWLS